MKLRDTFVILFTLFALSLALHDDIASEQKVEIVQPKLKAEDFTTEITAAQIVALTNSERRKVAVRPLTTNSVLSKIAQAKAELYARENYFDHVESDGTTYSDRFLEAGYSFSIAGENILVDALSKTTASSAVESFVESRGHYRNMVRAEYREIGVGIAIGMRGEKPAIWVVEEFGTQ